MVDLVKVRKKAKEKAEGKKQTEVPPAEPAQDPLTREPVNPLTRIAQFLEHAGEKPKTRKLESTEPNKTQLELLTFIIANEQYAIDIEHVVEIITPRPITRVPNADSSIVGILSLRGAIVTLIDVRSRLRHRAGEPSGPDVRIIVAEHEGENVGFIVDRVLRVVKVDEDTVQTHPVVHTSEQDEAVRGVFRIGDALTILLDLEKVLGVVRNGTYV